MRKIIRNFAVLEGADGSGTSTQLSLLKIRLNQSGHQNAFLTCEPTGKPSGVLIRSALKKEISLNPGTLAWLFAADRNEHLFGDGGIAEYCSRGELAVSDRYLLSSLVYQGLECGDELPQRLNAQFPGPELLIYLDLDSETAEERLRTRSVREIYETLEFQRRVREKYLSLLDECRKDGTRVELIDAGQSPEEVAAEIWRAVSNLPIFKTEN